MLYGVHAEVSPLRPGSTRRVHTSHATTTYTLQSRTGQRAAATGTAGRTAHTATRHRLRQWTTHVHSPKKVYLLFIYLHSQSRPQNRLRTWCSQTDHTAGDHYSFANGQRCGDVRSPMTVLWELLWRLGRALYYYSVFIYIYIYRYSPRPGSGVCACGLRRRPSPRGRGAPPGRSKRRRSPI